MNNVRVAIAGAVSLALMTVTACGSSSKSSSTGASAAQTNQTKLGASAPGASQSGIPEVNPAGDIPDNQAFVAFRDAKAGYSVSVPEGWSQTIEGAAVVFSDKYNVIRIQTRAISSPPTAQTVMSAELPAVAAAAHGYSPGSVSTADRKAGRAILATYKANSATNPVTGKYAVEAVERYAFYRPGHEVILTLAAPVGSDNVDPWRKVTDSFAWVTR